MPLTPTGRTDRSRLLTEHFFRMTELTGVAENFVNNAEAWQRVVAEPMHLRRYRLRAPHTRQVIADFRSHVKGHSVTGDPLWGAVGAAEADDLTRLLARWGPLLQVNGLVGHNTAAEGVEFQSVSLWHYRFLLRSLVSVWEMLDRPKSRARSQELDHMLGSAIAFAKDVAVEPFFRRGQLCYRVRPASLNSFLWGVAIVEAGRPAVVACLYCGTPLTPESRGTRGRPAEYCIEHRSSTFRERVMNGDGFIPPRAVVTEFDLEDDLD